MASPACQNTFAQTVLRISRVSHLESCNLSPCKNPVPSRRFKISISSALFAWYCTISWLIVFAMVVCPYTLCLYIYLYTVFFILKYLKSYSLFVCSEQCKEMEKFCKILVANGAVIFSNLFSCFVIVLFVYNFDTSNFLFTKQQCTF